MAAMARPSGRQKPVRTSRIPHTMKAPTAAGQPPSGGPLEASRAAPGVDQAMATGIRRRRPRTMAQSPIVTHSASSPEAACSAVAPAPRRPAGRR
jgi:hypothetical protein